MERLKQLQHCHLYLTQALLLFRTQIMVLKSHQSDMVCGRYEFSKACPTNIKTKCCAFFSSHHNIKWCDDVFRYKDRIVWTF
jgi:hypothetical protein